MKDINQIELLKRIQQDPVPYIGQRSFKLLQAYLQPFDIFCEFDIPNTDEPLLQKYPSIEQAVEKTYKLKLGTRGWWSPLKYYCEDERAHFELATNFILEYEKKYPNPHGVDYNLKLRNSSADFDLSKMIPQIGFRPEMYLGVSELACLRAYIDGHFFFKETFGLLLSTFEKKLLKFINPYKIENNKDFRTWDRNYRWKWDFAVYGSNERHSIPKFIKDIEEYTHSELKISINNREIKVDWSNYQSWWNKSVHELFDENDSQLDPDSYR